MLGTLLSPGGIKNGGGGSPNTAGGASSCSSFAGQPQQLLLPIPEMEMESLTLDQLQEMKDILSCDIRKIDNVRLLYESYCQEDVF